MQVSDDHTTKPCTSKLTSDEQDEQETGNAANNAGAEAMQAKQEKHPRYGDQAPSHDGTPTHLVVESPHVST
jgi:hypothetical protein